VGEIRPWDFVVKKTNPPNRKPEAASLPAAHGEAAPRSKSQRMVKPHHPHQRQSLSAMSHFFVTR
jgi:hypothetical protein